MRHRAKQTVQMARWLASGRTFCYDSAVAMARRDQLKSS